MCNARPGMYVWSFMWFVRLVGRWKSAPHWGHLCGRSNWWHTIWLLRSAFRRNRLPQILQNNSNYNLHNKLQYGQLKAGGVFFFKEFIPFCPWKNQNNVTSSVQHKYISLEKHYMFWIKQSIMRLNTDSISRENATHNTELKWQFLLILHVTIS